MAEQLYLRVASKKKGEDVVTREVAMGAGFKAVAKAAGHTFVGPMGEIANLMALHLSDPNFESAIITITRDEV